MKDREKLENIISEAKMLIKLSTDKENPQFVGWYTRATLFLHKKNPSYERVFRGIPFELRKDVKFSSSELRRIEEEKECARGLHAAIAILQHLLDDMEETERTSAPVPEKQKTGTVQLDKSKVFIVHGRNVEMKESVARLIEKQEIKAIILHEQANQGNTIIEKFEKNSDVGAAVCLFTADDLGREKDGPEEKKRARQNVVFEAGYFIGKLGRKNVIMIADSGVEIPTDMQGIVYADSANWQFSVLKELKAMGYNIDYNKLG